VVNRAELLAYLNDYLSVESIKDYCPNGLQVEGTTEIQTIVSGVTASQALIDKAIELNADAVLVHHGYFWKGESQTITGMKGRRIKALMLNDVNLMAYHLPLDLHRELGNNRLLGDALGLQDVTDDDSALVRLGKLEAPESIQDFVQRVNQATDRDGLHLSGGPELVQTVAWCTGAAQDYIEQAYAQGADVFISGEVSERTTHLASELGIHYIAAGHHATETFGVKALGEHLADRFALDHHFINLYNPV